jgi:hypothetical protein
VISVFVIIRGDDGRMPQEDHEHSLVSSEGIQLLTLPRITDVDLLPLKHYARHLVFASRINMET